MTHLGLSKDHFVWSFNTVAQSIAFISLPSTKYVITGYIMTITCRKSLRSYFDSRGTFSGSGRGEIGGGHMLPWSKWSLLQNAEGSSQRHWWGPRRREGGRRGRRKACEGYVVKIWPLSKFFFRKTRSPSFKTHVKLLLRKYMYFSTNYFTQEHKNASGLFWA